MVVVFVVCTMYIHVYMCIVVVIGNNSCWLRQLFVRRLFFCEIAQKKIYKLISCCTMHCGVDEGRVGNDF